MKKIKFMALFLSMALVFGSCGSMNNTAKGGVIGGGSGAASGAIIGGIAGKGKGAAIGAAVGTAVGAGAGVLIGRKMDKKAAEAEKIKDAQVEQVTDNNGLAAVKVTFPLRYSFCIQLFCTRSAASKQSLAEFANILKEDPTVDVAIIGHTDKVGSYEANQKVSANRAYAVENYLQACGVKPQFKKVEGVGYSQYNESETPEQNRRVEIFMYASEQMIKNAEAGK